MNLLNDRKMIGLPRKGNLLVLALKRKRNVAIFAQIFESCRHVVQIQAQVYPVIVEIENLFQLRTQPKLAGSMKLRLCNKLASRSTWPGGEEKRP